MSRTFASWVGMALTAGGALAVVVGAVGGLVRVHGLQHRELMYGSPWRAPADAPRSSDDKAWLGGFDLEAGQNVEVKACWREVPRAPADDVPVIEVRYVRRDHLVAEAALDRARFASAHRSGTDLRCVRIAHGRQLPSSGGFAVQLRRPRTDVDSEIRHTPMQVRAVAWTPLTWTDRWPVPVALAGTMALLVGLAWPVRGPWPPGDRVPTVARASWGVAALVGAGAGMSFVPLGRGAARVLGQGLVLALVQLGAVAVLIGSLHAAPWSVAKWRVARARLALFLPSGRHWTLMLAPFAGAFARWLGVQITPWLPHGGEAPVETVVSMPSGTLAMALIGTTVPLAEEIFFRGFVYGTLARHTSRGVAFVGATAAFAAAHLPQLWGAWGSFTSVAVTGVILTGLRAWTGSTVVAAFAHVTYNALIIASVW